MVALLDGQPNKQLGSWLWRFLGPDISILLLVYSCSDGYKEYI